jgi:REP element-mobilizing transposase RayT
MSGVTLGGETPPLRINPFIILPMTKFDPQKHHRRSIRLKGYDYSQEGAYYVTIVTLRRECLLGQVVNKEMILSPYGEIVQKWWEEIPVHFSNVEIGAFVIMPNHVHGIIYIVEERRGTVPVPKDDGENTISQDNDMSGENLGGETPPLQKFNGNPTLGQIIAYFKYQSTKAMNTIETRGVVTKFWQRNYYEHIIRDEKDLQNKTDYIESNPLLWDEDDENPVNGKK